MLGRTLLVFQKSPYICFMQEPYMYNNSIVGLPTNTSKYFFTPRSGTSAVVRSAICCPPSLHMWLLNEFATPDLAPCLWETGSSDCPTVVVASVYCDITKSVISPQLEQLVAYCDLNLYPLVLAMDSNAHNSLWGSADENSRGELLEEFILTNGLLVHNAGNENTFVAPTGSSIIDLTLSKTRDVVTLDNWRVDLKATMSDHRCICFTLGIAPPVVAQTRNILKTDWPMFAQFLQAASWNPPDKWSPTTVDTELEALTTSIIDALDLACPLRPPGAVAPRLHWWSDALEALRRRALMMNTQLRRFPSHVRRKAYHQVQHMFKRQLKFEKRRCWRAFCSDTKDASGMARLTKLLQKRENNTLGLLHRAGGGFTQSPSETIDYLIDTHFPGNIRYEPFPTVICPSKVLEPIPFITVEKVTAAISMFGPHKASGLDGIKPCVLQHLPPKVISRLTTIFQASVQLGHSPQVWRQSKVVFIPKPGKDDYTNVRSFRPISLMSFLFKTLERLVLWHLEETTLKDYPLHKSQHAFRRSYSTESALTDMADIIERAILRREYALGVFLDIEGAFDNLTPEAILRCLEARQVCPTLLAWYSHYLTHRSIQVSLKGTTAFRNLTKGTPQGGVLSPLMWNIVFDGLLHLFDTGPVKALGFADDSGLVATGPDPQLLCKFTQDKLQEVASWGALNGLSFSAKKSQAVFFLRQKYDWKLPTLKLTGVAIPYVNQVTYLGVIFDNHLSWRAHINHKILKTKRFLMLLAGVQNKNFGPPAMLTRWAYTCVARPGLLYGAIVWSQVCQNRVVAAALTKLNRMATLAIAPVRRSTPTAGLEVIYNVPPLSLLVPVEAVKALRRVEPILVTRWGGHSTTSAAIGHRRYIEQFRASIGSPLCALPSYPFDRQVLRLNWVKNFTVDKESFCLGHPPYPDQDTDFTCYTDGSRVAGHTGAGYALFYEGEEVFCDSVYLGTLASVFQAELYAITKACGDIAGFLDDHCPLTFYIDSQATLLALDSPFTTSKVVQECVDSLNRLGRNAIVTLRWIKAHVRHLGNERADFVAKYGASLRPDGPEPYLPVPQKVWDKAVSAFTEYKWQQQWQAAADSEGRLYCRQTKMLVPKIDRKMTKRLLLLPRVDVGRVVQLLTGHNYFNYHVSLIQPEQSALCRFCWSSAETSYHLLCECPRLRGFREMVFGHQFLHLVHTDLAQHHLLPFPPYASMSAPLQWAPATILQFLNTPPLQSLSQDFYSGYANPTSPLPISSPGPGPPCQLDRPTPGDG
jgi:ribonuclease HI